MCQSNDAVMFSQWTRLIYHSLWVKMNRGLLCSVFFHQHTRTALINAKAHFFVIIASFLNRSLFWIINNWPTVVNCFQKLGGSEVNWSRSQLTFCERGSHSALCGQFCCDSVTKWLFFVGSLDFTTWPPSWPLRATVHDTIIAVLLQRCRKLIKLWSTLLRACWD